MGLMNTENPLSARRHPKTRTAPHILAWSNRKSISPRVHLAPKCVVEPGTLGTTGPSFSEDDTGGSSSFLERHTTPPSRPPALPRKAFVLTQREGQEKLLNSLFPGPLRKLETSLSSIVSHRTNPTTHPPTHTHIYTQASLLDAVPLSNYTKAHHHDGCISATRD
ncbi:uncharacterized protein B0I36DRAFT_126437 [Microdochium trichocladiopsis]|uniref:Uncharacterized protein n=1 Tax=Microdochium trichocladiopsis TaxID=1682393 RepID=A0A9P8Y3Q3_9PEZI|nr:uncharacterized protein B0I36DRAFT_126437 [Microdochium trichocladiopsis]KAH7028834.1 hypothetical protein B0I36DRAFT_126437 [Microdochium trichocladiopsis]